MITVLPARNRLRRSADFSAAVRSGSRARRGTVVVHLSAPTMVPAVAPATDSAASAAPQVGLIVGKTVGNSVCRHQVSRRLRAQLAERLDRFPARSHVVVRALPEAATATSAQLGRDLDSALDRLALGARP